MTHELHITEFKCGKNTSYLCLFQEYYGNMRQQYKQIVFVYFLIQRQEVFLHVFRELVLVPFFMWVSSMSQTALGSWAELDECYPHLFL